MYSGTDTLWASLLEKLWTEVEAVCGSRAVRWHRASISLSDETEDDGFQVRQVKRKVAMYSYLCKGILFLAIILKQLLLQLFPQNFIRGIIMY